MNAAYSEHCFLTIIHWELQIDFQNSNPGCVCKANGYMACGAEADKCDPMWVSLKIEFFRNLKLKI